MAGHANVVGVGGEVNLVVFVFGGWCHFGEFTVAMRRRRLIRKKLNFLLIEFKK